MVIDAKNVGVVFCKPHASTDSCAAVVKAGLEAAGITIEDERTVTAADIEAGGMIDAHYGSLAVAAMTTEPDSLTLSDTKKAEFASQFGVEWAAARKVTNPAAMKELAVDGHELETCWRMGKCLKLAPGTYIAKLEGAAAAAGPATYTINGFYPAMRHEFVAAGASIRLFVVSFDAATLSWASFRNEVIGATDPATASPTSLRRAFLSRWQELGLAKQPFTGMNCVHASAGPIEGLKERQVWVHTDIAVDPFGAALIAAKGEPTVIEWLATNKVTALTAGGPEDKIFDLTEGMDAYAVLAAVTLADTGQK